MKTMVSPWLILAGLLCFCFLHAAQAEEKDEKVMLCAYSASAGKLRKFWNPTEFNSVSFPCRYNLTRIECGTKAPTVDVIVENGVDKKDNLFVQKISVIATYKGKTQTLEYTKDAFDGWMKKTAKALKKGKDFDDPLWVWSMKGKKFEEDDDRLIFGDYDEETKEAFVTLGDLTVSYKADYIFENDTDVDFVQIKCDSDTVKFPAEFGKTFCGNNDPSSSALEDDLYSEGMGVSRYAWDHNPEGLWFEYVTFISQTLQEEKGPKAKPQKGKGKKQDPQERNLQRCEDTSKLLSKMKKATTKNSDSGLGHKMYPCHFLVTPHGTGKVGEVYHRECLDKKLKKKQDFFDAYMSCLRAMSGDAGEVEDTDCDLLENIRKDCDDKAVSAPKSAKASFLIKKAETCEAKDAKIKEYKEKKKQTVAFNW